MQVPGRGKVSLPCWADTQVTPCASQPGLLGTPCLLIWSPAAGFRSHSTISPLIQTLHLFRASPLLDNSAPVFPWGRETPGVLLPFLKVPASAPEHINSVAFGFWWSGELSEVFIPEMQHGGLWHRAFSLGTRGPFPHQLALGLALHKKAE